MFIDTSQKKTVSGMRLATNSMLFMLKTNEQKTPWNVKMRSMMGNFPFHLLLSQNRSRCGMAANLYSNDQYSTMPM